MKSAECTKEGQDRGNGEVRFWFCRKMKCKKCRGTGFVGRAMSDNKDPLMDTQMRRILKLVLVFLGSVKFRKKNGNRQGNRPKRTVTTVSRILGSGGTLELDLRENLTKKY